MAYAAHGRAWLAGAVLGLAVGAGLYWTTPAQFRSTTVVELPQTAAAVDLSRLGRRAQPVTADTEAQILGSDQVVDAVARASGDPKRWVRESVTVTARPSTRILEITYTSRTPASATRGADAAVDAFLDVRDRLIVAPVEDYLSAVGERTDAPARSDVLATDDRAGSAEFRVEGWRERAVQELLALPGPGVVLERARPTSSAYRGDAEVPMASGACLGALLGLGVGLGRTRLRSQRRTPVRPAVPVVRPRTGS